MQHCVLWISEPADDYSAYAAVRNRLTATGHLGGSLAAAAVGLNPYCSPVKAWMLLKGRLKPDSEETEAMWCGRMLEPTLRQMFHARTGLEVWGHTAIYQHPERSWMIATPDGFLAADRDAREVGIVELKTTNQRLSAQWADGTLADMAHVQLLHTMIVVGVQWGYIGVLLGGQRFEVRRLEFDASTATLLIERETQFMASLQDEEPPAFEASDVDVMAALYPPEGVVQGAAVTLPPVAQQHIEAYRQGSAVVKEGERVKKEATANLQALLGSAAQGLVGDYVVEWTPRTREGYTVETLSYRHFQIKRKGK